MKDFLFALGALSLSGSAAIVLLALISRSTRLRYTARWRCLGWLLLLARMALPIPARQTAPVQAPIQLSAPQDAVVYTAPDLGGVSQAPSGQKDPRPNRPPLGSGTQPAQGNAPLSTPTRPAVTPAPAGPEEDTQTGFTLSLSQAVFFLWLAGAGAGIVLAAVRHLRFLGWLRRWGRRADDPEVIRMFNDLGNQLGLHRQPDLRVCPGLKGPMLAGLVRPVLLLPDCPLSEQDLHHCLLHELIHFRRRDIWLRSLALLVNALHWFNPLCWYMMRLVERDTELACDEQVLRALPQEERAAYGRTILDTAERLRAG